MCAPTQQSSPHHFVEDGWLRLQPAARRRMDDLPTVLSRQILEVIDGIVFVTLPELLDEPSASLLRFMREF